MKKIFLYSGIYDWTVQEILEQMAEVESEAPITYRLNSGGGSVFAAQGWLLDMKKRAGKNIGSVEGNASSMTFMSCLYMDEVHILSTSKALIHRAAMESDDEEDIKMLKEINADFRKAMESRLNMDKFTEITGKDLDAFFNSTKQVNIWLSAQQMVEIGFVKQENVFELTPTLAAEQSKIFSMGSYSEPIASTEANSNSQEANSNSQENLININNTMELTAVEAVAQERERVAAWNVWAKIDPDKVLAGIASGKTISAVESQEFMLASTNLTNLKEIQTNSPESVTTAKEVTAEELNVQKAEKEKAALFAEMGLKGDVK